MNKIALILVIFILGCQQEKTTTCDSCKSESDNIENVQNLLCKVVKFSNTVDSQYILVYDSLSMASSGYVVGSEKILVPCNISSEFEKNELFVIVDGEIQKECCELLTLPQMRSGFGCKFFIKNIKFK